jgi:hypothetical protein
MWVWLCALLSPCPVREDSAESSLEKALATVRTESIAADLRFLSSRTLGGRKTGSPGAGHAALFIRARLQRLGIEPGGDDGYYDRYVLELRKPDVPKSFARLGRGDIRRRLEPGKHYYFNWPSDIDVDAEIVFAGTGTREELAEIQVAGAWALVVEESTPWRFLAEDAQSAGANGILVYSESGKNDRHGEGPAQRTLDSLKRGRLDVAVENENPFPTVFLNRKQARFLLGGRSHEVGERVGNFHERRRLAPPSRVLKSENVCGLFRGSDSDLRREVIVVTAHFDHIGVRGGEIMPGADDNASGTSALMALAEALVRNGPLRRSVLLLFVSSGEEGQRGALAWVKEPTLPAGYRPVCNINLDTIGGNGPAELQLAPTESHEAHNGLEVLARQLAPEEGFSTLSGCDPFWDRSDQFPFHTQLKIPALYLFSGLTRDYHKASDTPDRVDCDKVRRVTRLVLRLLAALQEDELGA